MLVTPKVKHRVGHSAVSESMEFAPKGLPRLSPLGHAHPGIKGRQISKSRSTPILAIVFRNMLRVHTDILVNSGIKQWVVP
jgi:hypothetical protein